MQWLYPAGAWGLISLAAITALYLLRRKSESVTVPSLLLWQRAAAEQQAMRPFQKLKKNILYFLQMALALLLVLALLRPAVRGGVQGETVMIFDLSASMQAEESGVSRLEYAKRRASALLDSMGEGDRVTVLAAGSQAETRLSRSGDLNRVRAVIGALQAGNGGADLPAAVSLAQAMARDIEGLNILVFSDIYEGNGNVQVIRTGSGAENRAILSLSKTQDGQAFVRVANYGGAASATLECEADGVLADVVTVDLAENETRTVLMQARADAGMLHVSLAEKDALAADNQRWYVDREENAYRVALCGENVFVEKAAALRPDILLLRTSAAEAAALENIDLYIFDGALPEALPEAGALLSIAPDKAVFSVSPSPRKEAAGTLRAGYTDLARQLTQYLLLSDVALRSYTPLSGGEAVLRWNDDVLMAAAEENGRRAIVLGFDLHDSNLPMQGDFPVLMQQVLGWLLPDMRQDAADGVCGRAVAIPQDGRAREISAVLPSGRRIPGGTLLEDTREQGIYSLEYTYESGEKRVVRFALHVDGAECDVRQVGSAGGEGTVSRLQSDAGRELTLWVLLAFLALMLLEWEVSRRVA